MDHPDERSERGELREGETAEARGLRARVEDRIDASPDRATEAAAARRAKAAIVDQQLAGERGMAREQGRRDRPVTFADSTEFEQEYKRRAPDADSETRAAVIGFHDRGDGTTLVREGRPTHLTAVHEKLHQLSAGRLPEKLDEGVTEHLARRTVGGTADLYHIPSDYGRDGTRAEIADRAYLLETATAAKLEGVVGPESLQKAYFEGDVEQLRRKADAELGDGAYDRIVDALDRRDAAEVDRAFSARRPPKP